MIDEAENQEQPNARERIETYAELYCDPSNYAFEHTLVRFRQQSQLQYLFRHKANIIVEVGCGSDLLCTAARSAGLTFVSWIIVEPSRKFAFEAMKQTAGLTHVEVVEAFFESDSPFLKRMEGIVDVVILSSLLHEVEHPEVILDRAHRLLKSDGRIFAVVPSATSLHRRLAVAMDVSPELATLSDRNLTLLQRRVFDRQSLTDLCTRCSFEVVDSGGLFIKPFTNEQMTKCAPHLPSDIMKGLWKLGRDLPDLASEIYVEARK